MATEMIDEVFPDGPDLNDPEIAYLGKWIMNSDGMTELRTVVGLREGKIFAGVEQSVNGGEGFTTWADDASESLQAAIEIAGQIFKKILDDHESSEANNRRPKF